MYNSKPPSMVPKTVHFASEHTTNVPSPMYNTLGDSTFRRKKYSTRNLDRSKFDFSVIKENLEPRLNKVKKKRKKQSMSRSKERVVPFKYYPVIKSPLRK